MVWEIIESVTGCHRSVLREYVKGMAVKYVHQNVCKCGHMKWVHGPGTDNSFSRCSHCACAIFEAQDS